MSENLIPGATLSFLMPVYEFPIQPANFTRGADFAEIFSNPTEEEVQFKIESVGGSYQIAVNYENILDNPEYAIVTPLTVRGTCALDNKFIPAIRERFKFGNGLCTMQAFERTAPGTVSITVVKL